MKLGETSDPVYAYSFFVQEGYSTPAWPYDKAVKTLEMIDGSVDVVNFGAREHRDAQFSLNWSNRAAQAALKNFINANMGAKIRVQIENAGERVFGEQYTASVYYAYLTKARDLGEAGFTPGHQLNGYALEMDLAGTLSTSVHNAADSSQYEILFVNDCARITAGCQVANLAALNAITTKPGGSRGLTIDNLKLYIYNVRTTAWEYQYTLPDNDPSMGLKYGVFRWSAFADVSGASSGVGGEYFKSGWIVEKSFKPPRYSVDARQGPAMEHPEGYSYSVPNFSQIWKFPLDNNLAFYGAKNEAYFYDRLHGVKQLIRTGYNNRNAFDYQKLDFEIEPGVFLGTPSWPNTTAGKGNYPDAAEAVRGKPILATYGRWDKGRLQTIGFNMDAVRFPNGKKHLATIAWDSGDLELTIGLAPAEVSGILGYAYGSYPATDSRYLYAAIFAQDDQPDVNKLRRVLEVADAAGNTVLTLEKGFQAVVDSTALIILYLSNVQIVVDENEVVGLRKAGYLLDGNADTAPLQLYGEEGGVLKAIPPSTFNVVDNGLENEITVNTNNISLESKGEVTVQDAVPLALVNPFKLHSIVDKLHVNGFGYFDFGFSPRGVGSNEVKAFSISRGILPIDFGLANFMIRTWSLGLRAAYSEDFTILAWSPYEGATGYRLTRYTWMIPVVKTNRSGSSPAIIKIDTSFGGGAGVDLEDGTHLTGTGGVVTITGSTHFLAIDKSVSSAEPGEYFYTIEAVANGQAQPALKSARGRNRVVASGASALQAIPQDESIVLIWPVPSTQASFTVEQDGAAIGGMPVASATLGWHLVTGLTNNQEYTFKVYLNSLALGTDGDTWFQPAGLLNGNPIHQLLRSTDTWTAYPYRESIKYSISDLSNPAGNGLARAFTMTIRNSSNNQGDFPAAGVVFSWLWQMDKEKIADLSGSKDVRLLADFVVSSFIGDDTPVPFIIQLRGLTADGTTVFTKQYDGDGAGMTAKTPPETGAKGAYARFENLPKDLAGSNSDENYETEASAPNAAGLYTGKDLWKLYDWLFEDGAEEWLKVEYFMFSITNAVSIPAAQVNNAGLGYRIGIGGPPGANWTQVRNHKPDLYLEFTNTFEGGLSEPLFARIDGGRVDDAAGSITGTAGKIIEKAKHVTSHVIESLTGKAPLYLGNEMASRDSWIWRWQAQESRSLQDTLQTLLWNLWAIAVISPDDNVCIRTLNVDEKNNPPVFAFTPANILKDSLSKDGRRRNEIFQKFLLKYNVEPSVGDGDTTEEMLVGWDLATGKPIFSGYSRVKEDANGNLVDEDGMDGMDFLVRVSSQLYAAGVAPNEFGTDPDDPKVFEMFYRPTRPSSLLKQPVERTLPNLSTLWPEAKAPKLAMQDLTRIVIRFFALDAWYFTLSTPMKNVIYNAEINGVADAVGTPDRRLKLGDLVTVMDDFYTAGQAVKGFILDIELDSIYDGYVRLHVFCPTPPGQFGPGVDKFWDAGGPGPRRNQDLLFKGNLYGLLSEDGTFADAKGPGVRDNDNMTFPDGTLADAEGLGSGKA